MPSGKRHLRSASSESRSTKSPLVGGTYIKKETPGGLQRNNYNKFNLKYIKNYFKKGLKSKF
jgi:hypothetical protein